ncbi:MAG: sirohydrochlorin chelatase [Micrococcales bacterium]
MEIPRQVVLVSHGTSDPVGAAAVSRLVAAVAEALPGRSVHETYVDVQHPQLAEVLSKVADENPDDRIALVPLLLSNGYHIHKDIPEAVASLGIEAQRVTVTEALGPAPELVEVLVSRLREAGWTPDDQTLLVVAGSSDANAIQDCQLLQLMFEERIRGLNPAQSVELAYLSAASPRVKDLVPKLKFQNPRRRVALANYLLAPGYFNDRLGETGAQVVAAPLLTAEGQADERLVQLVLKRLSLLG